MQYFFIKVIIEYTNIYYVDFNVNRKKKRVILGRILI